MLGNVHRIIKEPHCANLTHSDLAQHNCVLLLPLVRLYVRISRVGPCRRTLVHCSCEALTVRLG